jgi:hypothetical protein
LPPGRRLLDGGPIFESIFNDMVAVRTPTLHVIATTVEGTEAALKAAVPLAAGLGARIVLLLSKAEPLEPVQPSSEWLIAHYKQMALRLEKEIEVRVCDCADRTTMAKKMTPRGSTIVIGGPALWIWPGAEERVAARLRRSGRDVVFIGCNSD